jgi:M6 family metalloprotease-like protein
MNVVLAIRAVARFGRTPGTLTSAVLLLFAFTSVFTSIATRGATQKPSNRSNLLLENPPVGPKVDVITPRSGTLQNIVVFISFSDQTEFGGQSTYFEGLFNDTSPGASSLYNYFKEVSYDQLFVNSTFYPIPSGGTVVSYHDAHPHTYYEPYDPATNPDGYTTSERRWSLIVNAINSIASQVPVSLNIDSDGDGWVDHVTCILRETVSGMLMTQSKSNLNGTGGTINGKKVDNYTLLHEASFPTKGATIACHEMIHSLGSPDLYHYTMDGLDPVNVWDIMDAGDGHPSAYTKFRYLGWISSIPEILSSGTYTLYPLQSPTNNCYRIASPFSREEFFVVEYRKKEGAFESSLPGEGLLVYRINARRSGQGNSLGPPDEIYAYRPYGTNTQLGNWVESPFSANSGKTSINDATNPSSFLSDGSPGGLSISNVGAIGTTISFDVTIYIQPPTILAATGVGTRGFTALWNSVLDATGYRLDVSTSSTFTNYVQGFDNLLLGDVTSYSVAKLNPNTTYFYRVRAVKGTGMSPSSQSQTVTTLPMSVTLSIDRAPAGAFVTFQGGSFDTDPSRNVVRFGSVRAPVMSASTTALTVRVPAGASFLSPSVAVDSLILNAEAPFTTTFRTDSLLSASSFGSAVKFATGSSPTGVVVGDFDDDGKPDLLTANVNANTVSLLRSLAGFEQVSTSSFAAKVDFAVGAAPWAIVAADFDGDGKLDIATANSTGFSITVMRNTSTQGTISFASRIDLSGLNYPRSIAAADLDCDGMIDIIAGNYVGNTVFVFKNTTHGGVLSFAAPVSLACGSGPMGVTAADFDNDGRVDIASANGVGNSISVFRNQGTLGGITSATFATKVDHSTGLFPWGLATGDLDRDGYADVVTTNYAGNTITLLRNTSTPGAISFSNAGSPAAGSQPSGIAIGDLDGDARLDVAVSNQASSGGISVFHNISTGGEMTFAARFFVPTGTYARATDLGSVDGDAAPEIIAANNGEGTVGVLRNLKLPLSGCANVPVASRWNLVSIPMQPADSTVTNVMPGAMTPAYTYAGSYSASSTLSTGKGYWLKFADARSYSLCGVLPPLGSVPVTSGWNLLGSFDTSVGAGDLRSIPDNLIESDFFGYSNGYKVCTRLEPGQAYWVKLSQAGSIYFSGMGYAKPDAGAVKQALADCPMLEFASPDGSLATLYLGPADQMKAGYELPPLPPDGVFDVRFMTGSYAEPSSSQGHDFKIQSGAYPVSLRGRNLGGRQWRVRDLAGTGKLDAVVTEGTSIVIPTGVTAAHVEESAGIPLTFGLSQNSPNPFNPRTVISYQLPASPAGRQVVSKVGLVIYDLLGREVRTLIDGIEEAGYKTVAWDSQDNTGNHVASGVYLYRLEAGDYVSVKKMLLVR